MITTPAGTIDVALSVTTTAIGLAVMPTVLTTAVDLGLAVRVVGATWARRVTHRVPTRRRDANAGDVTNRAT